MQRDQFQVHSDAELNHWWFRARRRILCKMINAVLPPGLGKTILDVGCGTGANAAALTPDYNCVGVDTSHDAIDLARQRFPGTRFVCGQAPQVVSDVAQQADLFLMSDVLEHIEDDFWALSQLIAVARPGAHFLLTVPADESLWSGHDESHGHYRRYDRTRFRQLWEGLPIRERLCVHMNSRLFPLIKCVRTLNRALGRTAGDAGTDVRVPNRWTNSLLEWIFAGEGPKILKLVDQPAQRGPFRGVSLIALLQRQTGDVAPRTKPSGTEPDRYNPQFALAAA